MTRETSIEAYRFVEECGWIGEKQRQVYRKLREMGPSTSAEVYREIFKDKPGRETLTQSRARFTELRDMGAIREAGKRACGVTGRLVLVWEVTKNIPTRIEESVRTITCPTCGHRSYQREKK